MGAPHRTKQRALQNIEIMRWLLCISVIPFVCVLALLLGTLFSFCKLNMHNNAIYNIHSSFYYPKEAYNTLYIQTQLRLKTLHFVFIVWIIVILALLLLNYIIKSNV